MDDITKQEYIESYLKLALEDLDFFEEKDGVDYPVIKYHIAQAYKLIKMDTD